MQSHLGYSLLLLACYAVTQIPAKQLAEKPSKQPVEDGASVELSQEPTTNEKGKNDSVNDYILRMKDEIRAEIKAEMEVQKNVLLQAMLKMAADIRHEEEAEKIAFSVASYESFGRVTVDTVIPFEFVYTSIGGGWNVPMNAFQAPVAGTYFFTASIFTPGGNNGFAAMKHTGAVSQTEKVHMGTTSAGGTAHSNQLILQLDVDDFINVLLLSRGDGGPIYSAYDEVYTTFSGFLLFT